MRARAPIDPRPAAAILLACTLGLGATGCIMPFNGPGGVRRDIEKATGREYDCSFALTVGRSGMALTRWIVQKAEEEPLPFDGLKKVEIGIYRMAEEGAPAPAGAGVGAIEWPGWSPLVEVSPESGESVRVLFEAGRDGTMRRMLFVVEDGEDLVVVRLKGDLQELIEESIKYALEQADREDLVGPILEEYHRDSAPSAVIAGGS